MNTLFLLAEEVAESSFVRLFTEMNEVTIILFVLGIIFCAIEMFIPGFGFFGITGSIMIVAGMVVRLICGGDAMMLLYMVLIALAMFFLMFFVMSRLILKTKLSKTAIFSVKPAVSEDKTEGTKDFSEYVGKCGVAQTMLRPVGKANFDGAVLDVVARESFIQEGATVECVQVEGQRIVVVEKSAQ